MINYTTTVAFEKSITEIQASLRKFGAQSIAVDYSYALPVRIRFSILIENSLVEFGFSCLHEGIHEYLLGKDKIAKKYQTKEHAMRVAWRLLKTWIDAQLSIVEARMAVVQEVFLPYALVNNATFYKVLDSKNRIRTLALDTQMLP